MEHTNECKIIRNIKHTKKICPKCKSTINSIEITYKCNNAMIKQNKKDLCNGCIVHQPKQIISQCDYCFDEND